MIFASILWIISLIAAYFIGKRKNQLSAALLLCLFLGPLGLCITLLIPSKPVSPPSAMPAKP